VPEAHRPVVVERCYWPLLRMIRALRVPMGIELTGMTLRWIDGIDPAWLAEFRALQAEGLVELVGSGRSQLIAPLVPWRVNAANLRAGLRDYETMLGLTPETLLVNEQAYSRACVDHALDAGFKNVVIEWENAWRANPSWDKRWTYAPQLVRSSKGETARLLWNQSIAFQKVQRFVHGELELSDLLAYVDAQRGPEERAFCIYGNDAEVFDYRPGRFQTESIIEHHEWERLGELFAALKIRAGIAFELPRTVAASEFTQLGDRRVEPQSAAEPVPTKKQGKYNVTRWAVTGRDDLFVNTTCQRIHDSLVDVPLDDPRWGELCELWSSDFRTHITDERWTQVLVFVATRYATEHVATKLRRAGINAVALHGDLAQGARSQALADFKAGKVRVLLATDVAARGIDILQLPVVVNYDLPRSTVDYVHRIGRTARAGEAGIAVSFVSADTEAHFRLIEKRHAGRLVREVLPGFEPLQTEPSPPAEAPLKARRSKAHKAAAASDPATPAAPAKPSVWPARWGSKE
jgi:hypothetical protein